MTLQDYTTEELKAELKRRCDLAKAEKAVECAHIGVKSIILALLLMKTLSKETEDVVSFLKVKQDTFI